MRAVLCAETDQFVERKMAKLHRSGNYQETALREGVVIGGMLNDLWRTIQILNIDISTEEERARVFDMRDPAYPILARMMAARRGEPQAHRGRLGASAPHDRHDNA